MPPEPPDDNAEGEALWDAIRSLEEALRELEEYEIDDEDSARELEVVLDEVTSSVNVLLPFNAKLDRSQLPAKDLFAWLCERGMFDAGGKKALDVMTEVSASCRYGEELERRKLKETREAKEVFVEAVRAMVEKEW